MSFLLLLASLTLAEVPPGDAAKGKPTYKALCAPCHGDTGKGNGPAAAGLNPRPVSFDDPAAAERLTRDWVLTITRDGGAASGKSPLMVPMGAALTPAQLADVTAYVLTLKAQPR